MYQALVDRAYEAARGPTAQDAWAEAAAELRASWEILKEKYGHEERAEPAPQADGGSWRGKGGRALDAARNAEIDLGYARIREVGENVIVPAILRIAAEDPTRTLAGFDRRIKGEDRLKEKISDACARTPAVRPQRGVGADLRRRAVHIYVRARPHSRLACARTWSDSKSPGSLRSNGATRGHPTSTRESTRNGVEPQSGVRFEVQFHTQASLEAKELTHAGVRANPQPSLNRPQRSIRETAELKQFQRQGNAKIPIPPGVCDIEDYRPERHDG